MDTAQKPSVVERQRHDVVALEPSAPASSAGHSDTVRAVVSFWSTAGAWRVASGSSDHTLRIWEAQEAGAPVELAVLKGHTGGVFCLTSFDCDGDGRRTRLVSGSFDNTLRIWEGNPVGRDSVSQSPLKVLVGHRATVSAVMAFSGGGGATRAWRLLSADGKELRLWDPDAGAGLGVITLETPVHALCTFDGGSTIGLCAAWAAGDGTVGTQGVFDGGHLAITSAATVTRAHSGSTFGVAGCGRGRLVSCGEDGMVCVHDAAGSEAARPRRLPGHTAEVNAVVTFELAGAAGAVGAAAGAAGGGWRVVSCSEDRTLRLWDPVGGTALAVLTGHTHPVLDAVVRVGSVEDKGSVRVVSGGEDSVLRTWCAPQSALQAAPAAMPLPPSTPVATAPPPPPPSTAAGDAAVEYVPLACVACGAPLGWLEADVSSRAVLRAALCAGCHATRRGCECCPRDHAEYQHQQEHGHAHHQRLGDSHIQLP